MIKNNNFFFNLINYTHRQLILWFIHVHRWLVLAERDTVHEPKYQGLTPEESKTLTYFLKQ